MKMKFYLHLLSILAIVGLASCSGTLKPLAADYVKSDPQPLEEVGGKVPVTINTTFPPKWFNKKASVTLTPLLKYNGGEVSGTPYTYQGEKVAGNGQVIPQKLGSNVTMTSSFDFVPGMEKSDLYLTFDSKVGNKKVNLPDLKIGDGVLASEGLADPTATSAAIAPDKFQRIIKEAHDANIMFLIEQANLRSSELKKGDLSAWKKLVQDADKASNKKVDLEVSAYASPDGGFNLNNKLAADREHNTNQYLRSQFNKKYANIPINANYTAQDWEGFQELVSKSNIQDKDLVLRVLSMYKDPEQREKEIRNISSVFSVLADQILPQLRRSRLTANVQIVGKSDDEISKLAADDPSKLNVEELLYAATLVNTPGEKEAIYKKVADEYPNDYRAYNNIGAIEFNKGNISEAKSMFDKSAQVAGTDEPEINFNNGLLSLVNGDKDKAQQYFGKSSDVKNLNGGLGLLALKNGQYSQAAEYYGNTNDNNAALSQILSKDYSKAESTLNAVNNPNATTSYLKAIVASRTNNKSDVISNLKDAISKDSRFASKAATDLEFSKYFTDQDFLNLVK